MPTYRLTYGDQTYPFDLDTLLVPESEQVYDFTGLNPFEWRAACAKWNGRALWALWALARARGGDPSDNWDEECKSFNILAFSVDTDDEEEDPDLPTGPDAAG